MIAVAVLVVAVAWAGAVVMQAMYRREVPMAWWIAPIPLAITAFEVGIDGVDQVAATMLPALVALMVLRSPDGRPVTATAKHAQWVVLVVTAIAGAMHAQRGVDDLRGVALVHAAVCALVVLPAFVSACGAAGVIERSRLQWVGWGFVVSVALLAGMVGLRAVTNGLDDWAPVAVLLTLPAPLGVAASAYRRLLGVVATVLVHSVVWLGMAAFVAVVYLIVVVGLYGRPVDGEATVLVLSIVAAAVVAVFGSVVQHRLRDAASRRVYGQGDEPDQTLEHFATRMSRAIPMDELLLQLVESLRKTMKLTSAEVWTGSEGRFEQAVGVPHRSRDRIIIGGESLGVAARAHVQGNTWLSVWVPDLLVGREGSAVRFTSVAHLGELLGFIVTERPTSAVALDEDDEHRVLIDIARQLGLALHNVRLDNALQASLDELQSTNEELVRSRARIVAATDESRRRIERNLHDGAQQHLVALAVKVGLVRTLLDSDPETATRMLEELRGDVQVTLTELRELAHGIYPPRLRDRGLVDALGAAADRSPLPASVEAGEVGRYGPDLETAVYFCCLEAIQNAGKHAGPDAEIRVTLNEVDGVLEFSVCDNGAGFDAASVADSHGFVNMRDRLGAFAGQLRVISAPEEGTQVFGRVPL